MASDPLSRNYAMLAPHERFPLVVEAMVRGDEAEADRLEDSCPRRRYDLEDQEFRDRMTRSYTIALMACLNLRAGLGHVRAAVTFSKVCRYFAAGPALAAQLSFLFGREYARWEAGGKAADIPAGEALAEELRRCPDLKVQLAELKDIAGEAMADVSRTLTYAIGVAHAADLLGQWEGFGRFCRRSLGVEPLTLVAAFRLKQDDPAAEVLATYPDAQADEAVAAEWEANWTREWERRFPSSAATTHE